MESIELLKDHHINVVQRSLEWSKWGEIGLSMNVCTQTTSPKSMDWNFIGYGLVQF
jgi:hypothetical protein